MMMTGIVRLAFQDYFFVIFREIFSKILNSEWGNRHKFKDENGNKNVPLHLDNCRPDRRWGNLYNVT